MCRILLVKGEAPFAIESQLLPFAAIAENSREYQGHGWGCSWLDANQQWQHYHNIQPVWEDNPSHFPQTTLLLVHARSAFRDEGIAVENNMPFTDGESVVIFNGELRGVRIKSEGRIGAEKIYNYFRRLDKGDKLRALEKSVSIINKRTSYVRAMNLIIADKHQQYVSSTYSEDPDYFQLSRWNSGHMQRICSAPFAGESGWTRIENHTTFTL